MTGYCGEGMIAEEAKPAAERKYGGLAPKKKPLISKDARRAFFDSADWALCKEGAVVTYPAEPLRPKLQPTPRRRLPPRRPACSSTGEELSLRG